MSLKETVSLNNIERAIKAAQALHDVELKEALADTKLDLVNAKELIANLKDENRILKEQINLKSKVKYDEFGIAWIDDGAHCSGCLGSKEKQVRLKKLHDSYFQCPACDTYFNTRP